MEFALKEFGDDLNLYYVAVTRPKKSLKLPPKYWAFTELIQEVKARDSPPERDDEDFDFDEDGVSKPKPKIYTQAEWNGLKVLFSTFY